MNRCICIKDLKGHAIGGSYEHFFLKGNFYDYSIRTPKYSGFVSIHYFVFSFQNGVQKQHHFTTDFHEYFIKIDDVYRDDKINEILS